MANYLVVSPGQLTEGGDSGDLFSFRSAAVSASTVVGGAGADTVEMLDSVSSAKNVSITLKGGADVVTLSASVLTAATLKGGAGGDTINFSGVGAIDNVMLGDGSDVVTYRGATDLLGGSVAAGAGADLLSGNAAISASGASLLMGAGKDTVTLTASEFASGVAKGGGNDDKITLNIAAGTDWTIDGGAGNDSVFITAAAGTFDSADVLLGDGNDELSVNGDISDTGLIDAGVGDDSLSFNTGTFAEAIGLTIAGGDGADTIAFNDFASAGSGAVVLGGGGNDSIIFDFNQAEGAASAGAGAGFSAGNGYGTIAGGAGADSITFSAQFGGVGSAGMAGVIGFTAFSDSTESSQDVVFFDKSAGDHYALLNLEIASGVGNDSRGAISLSSNGFLQSAGDNSSVDERISAMDALLVTGEAGVFKDASGSAAYLFVQGGATDLVVKFDPTTNSAGAIGLSAAASGDFKISFQ